MFCYNTPKRVFLNIFGSIVHGNELFGPSGEIASPLYPKIYEENTLWSDSSVTWRITVDFQSVILISFKDFFINWFIGGECFATGLEVSIIQDNI